MKELCVSKESLAAEGPVPEMGDKVSFETAGTVTRVVGDKIYLHADTANGVPLPEEAAEKEPDDDDMRELGADADRKEGYL